MSEIKDIKMTNKVNDNMKENIMNYQEQIVTLEDFVAGVRQNIGMYIGRKGNYGMINMIREIVQNGLDEVNKHESPATMIAVSYDERNKQTIVKDNGRGIPFGNIITIFSREHTSSNYVKKKGEYSSGLHGVGSKVTNALSKSFTVDSYILGEHRRVEFIDGHPITEEYDDEKNVDSNAQGTVISFIPAEEVLGEISITFWDVLALLKLLLPITQIGTEIYFTGISIDGKYHTEKMVNIDGIITNLIEKTRKPLIKPVFINSDTGEMRIEAAFTYDSESLEDYDVTLFSNFCPTSGGTHEKGFLDGIVKYFKNQMNKVYLANNKKKLTATNQDVLTGLQGIIHVCHIKPIFTGQAKDVLSNEDIYPFVRDTIVEQLELWGNQNNKDLQRLCKFFKEIAEVRVNAEKGKMKLAKKYNASSVTGLPKQYHAPSGKKDLELIIVEGKSAMGSAVNSRDPKVQGIFPIRGKTPNPFTTVPSKLLANEEIGAILQIIGCGVGKNCDITKSRISKVIIAADADPDGNHIAANLSSTFAIYTPQLVEAGMLYKVIPPLYSVRYKGKENFFPTRMEYVEFMQQIFSTKNDLKLNGKIMTSDEISKMAYANVDYRYDLECMSRNYAVNPRFLESVIKYKHLSFQELEAKLKGIYGHTVQIFNDGKFINIVGLIDNIYQTIIITDRFIAESDNIKNKYLYNSNDQYSINGEECRYLYDLMSKFDNSGTNMKITRYKGLGELDPHELGSTTLSDQNRTLVRYTMEDIKRDIEKLRTYDSDKKKLIKDSVATRSDLLG